MYHQPIPTQKEALARVFRATFSIGSAVAPLWVAGVVPPPIPSANGPRRVLGKMAAIECAVGSTPCLHRRLGDQETACWEVAAWETPRHAAKATVEWRVTTHVQGGMVNRSEFCPAATP
jgi:hypothetical protein